MAWRRLFITTQATRHQFRTRLCCSQKRFQSSFLGNLSRRLLGGAHDKTTTEVAQQNDPEAVITEFESHSSLHANPQALSQYIKALVKLDRLEQSQFVLNIFQRGLGVNEQVKPSAESNIKFRDVKCAYYPKAELKEIVDYLRDPKCFAHLGAKVPKGYLLTGATGTVKMMLASTVAREAGVPFFSCNGREFEAHFGVGARRMRDIFAAAKKQSRSIIFIDEIDKIHTKMTFNQLIVELDGLKQKSGIIVIAAAHDPDSLDKALLKHGRFERRADILEPDEYVKRHKKQQERREFWKSVLT